MNWVNYIEELAPEEKRLAREIEGYASVFDSAWNRFLEDVRKGETIPANEAEMRCYLFSQCLITLKKKKFGTPYEIGVEDIEVYGGNRADLTLGFLGEQRCITVEVKYFPKTYSIRRDLAKLRRFIQKNRFAVGYFVMIGRKNYQYKDTLDLEKLGFREVQDFDPNKKIIEYML